MAEKRSRGHPNSGPMYPYFDAFIRDARTIFGRSQTLESDTSQRIRMSLLKTSLKGFDIVSYFVSQHTERCRARFTSRLGVPIYFPTTDRQRKTSNILVNGTLIGASRIFPRYNLYRICINMKPP